jgi:hypothetical protein
MTEDRWQMTPSVFCHLPSVMLESSSFPVSNRSGPDNALAFATRQRDARHLEGKMRARNFRALLAIAMLLAAMACARAGQGGDPSSGMQDITTARITNKIFRANSATAPVQGVPHPAMYAEAIVGGLNAASGHYTISNNLFIGNTAERVLEEIESDLVVVPMAPAGEGASPGAE